MNEVTNKKVYSLKEREDNLKEAIKNGGFIGDNGTWNSILVFNGDKHIYRHRVETIVVKDLNEVFLKFDKDGNYYFPAGSVEKDLPLSTQAINECNEEARINVRNIEHTGITYKEHEPPPKGLDPNRNFGIQWDGKYTEIFIGEYDGIYRKKVDEEDVDNFIASGRFYPIKSVINKMRKEHKTAIFNYLKMRNSSSFNEKSDNESFFSCKIIDELDLLDINESADELHFSENVFYKSIEDAVQNCIDKEIGDMCLILSPKSTVSGKIIDYNRFKNQVTLSGNVDTYVVKAVRILDDKNYLNLSFGEPKKEDNSVVLYHPTCSTDDTNYDFDNQVFLPDYDSAYNYAVYLALKTEFKKLYNNKMFEWVDQTNKISCDTTTLNTINRHLSNHNLHGRLYSVIVNKDDIVNGKLIRINKNSDCVLFTFIINPTIVNSTVDIIRNPIETAEKEFVRKYCVIGKNNPPYYVSDSLTKLIKDYINGLNYIDYDQPVTVICSNYFDVDKFNSYDDIDGYPVKKISKPLKMWCSQCKINIFKRNNDLPVSEKSMSHDNKIEKVKLSIDLETTIIIEYLNTVYNVLNHLYTVFKKDFDEFGKPSNTNEDAAKEIEHLDKIITNLNENVFFNNGIFETSSNKIIRQCVLNPDLYKYTKMNFNSYYLKFKKLFEKYNSLIDDIDAEMSYIIKYSPEDSTTSKIKYNRLSYRVADIYKITGRIYIKLNEMTNPEKKVNIHD